MTTDFALLLAIGLGAIIAGLVSILLGVWTGVLVAKLGIPAFVVTLANFLVFQGILLILVKEGGSVRVTNPIVKGIIGNNITNLEWDILYSNKTSRWCSYFDRCDHLDK